MTISSRTPDGTPNHCPVCGAEVKIVPSAPAGDAPCPSCGSLLWFVVREPDVFFRDAPVGADQDTTAEPNALIGTRVRIKEGTFENWQGEVSTVDAEHHRLTIIVNMFGRLTPVELEARHVESV